MADHEPPAVEIRPIEEADLDRVIELTVLVAPEGRLGVEPGFDAAARRATLASWIGSPNAGQFVAVVDGEVVGQLSIGVQPYGVAELGMLVAPDRRRRGIGAALVAAAIDWARGAGAHKVSLQVWPDNEPAIALYERFGFRREGELVDHYRRADGSLRTAVFMALLLDRTDGSTDGDRLPPAPAGGPDPGQCA